MPRRLEIANDIDAPGIGRGVIGFPAKNVYVRIPLCLFNNSAAG
jgi:hypothetical protein